MASCYRYHEDEVEGDQEVMACGRNDTGQLGVGDSLEHLQLHRVAFSSLNRCRILLLATGTHHTLALTTHEKSPLFGWGWGKYGQLGTGSMTSCFSPVAIPVHHLLEGSDIIDINAGYSHSAFVTTSGRLFTTGRNDMGQLGLGHILDMYEFTHVKQLSNIVKVAVGEYFCVALERSSMTGDERIWSFGSNEFGQLGLGDFVDRSRPQQVKIPELSSSVRIHLLRTGPFHCVMSLSNHRIFSWGRGDCGQTGLGFRRDINSPTEMTRLMEMVGNQPLRLLSVRAHNVAVTSHSGEIFVWGRNNRAQLGLATSRTGPDGSAFLDPYGGSDLEDHAEPQRNTVLGLHGVQGAHITEITVGPFHTNVLMDDGKIIMWGAINDHGIPKTNPRFDATEETSDDHIPMVMALLQGRTVTHIGAGYSHVIFVLNPPMKLNPSTLTMDMGATLDDPTFSDITILVQDRSIHAHKVVLASRSRFFRAMFASGMLESKQKEVTIRDCSYEAFYAILLYLYTDSYYRGRPDNHTAQLALEVLPLAELYDIPRLLQLCEVTLIDTLLITIENVLDLYELSCRTRAMNLKQRCHWFISKHFNLIVTSDAWISKFPNELKSKFDTISKLLHPQGLPSNSGADQAVQPPKPSSTDSAPSKTSI